MNCKHFRTRTKAINKKRTIYNYCSFDRKIITYNDCKECKNKEYKEYKRLQAKTEYKYKPKKGKSNRYYNDVSIMPKNPLYSNIKKSRLEKHHIFGGIANRPKSEKYGLFVWLTENQHRYLTDHPLENLKLKQLAQITFMEYYNKTTDEFIEIFGKNYLFSKKY